MQGAPTRPAAECRGMGSACQPGFHQAALIAAARLNQALHPAGSGCPLESVLPNDAIVQYLKGKSKNPMKIGIPSGPGKGDCLATSTYCSSQLFLSGANKSPDKSVWIF